MGVEAELRWRTEFPVYGLRDGPGAQIIRLGGLGKVGARLDVRWWGKPVARLLRRRRRKGRRRIEPERFSKIAMVAVAYNNEGCSSRGSRGHEGLVVVETTNILGDPARALEEARRHARSFVAMSAGATVESLGERVGDPTCSTMFRKSGGGL